MEHTLTGSFRCHRLTTKGAATAEARVLARDCIVYLPPGYNDNERRYPVLYLHDGQNLFDAATAFCQNEWGLDEVLEQLIGSGEMEPILVVGIYNAGDKRLAEYTPVRDRRGQGGEAKRHARFVVNELKPFLDAEYRTLADATNTGIGGSSLGGLVTLYFGLQYPEVFGKLAVMSPSIWWAQRAILRAVRRARGKSMQRIWLDIGTSEGEQPGVHVQNAREVRDALMARGWQENVDLKYCEDEGAGHTEQAWGRRMRMALPFLFPPKFDSQ